MSRRPIIIFLTLLVLVSFIVIYLPPDLILQLQPNAFQKVNDTTNSGSSQPDELDESPMAEKMTDESARKILGRSSWTLLHVMATKFPANPTKENTADLITFVNLLSTLYPCGDCAAHFKKWIKANPIDKGAFTSKKGVTDWFCNAHNDVNRRLGKPIYDCALVTERWKCGCPDEIEEAVGELTARPPTQKDEA